MIDSNQKALLELIGSSLFDKEPSFPEDTDWDEVLKEAKAQTVVALARRAVPAGFSAAWEIPAAQSEAHFMRLLFEQTRLVGVLTDEGIPFVVIKGTAAAIYYPNPSKRTMGDIDVLVAENSFESAFSLLKEKGYLFIHDLGDGRDYTFTRNDIVIELHKRYSDRDFDIEACLAEGIKNAQTRTLCGSFFPALPELANGLLLVDHIRHHLFGGLGLRQIIDFMMFVNSVPDEEKFESDFLPVFEKSGLGTLAKVIAKMGKRYFGLPADAAWCLSADDGLCGELLEAVFSSGNFGVKAPYEYRPMQSFTMSVKKQGFFRTLQRAGVENCEAFRKHKLLRPFAWIYQLFRYLKRGIAALFGREKLLDDVTSGKEKADFYKRLGIQ